MQDEIPIIIMLYDILEWEGKDIRNYHLIRRKEILESLYKKIIVYNAPVLLSQVMFFENWKRLKRKEKEQTKNLVKA